MLSTTCPFLPPPVKTGKTSNGRLLSGKKFTTATLGQAVSVATFSLSAQLLTIMITINI